MNVLLKCYYCVFCKVKEEINVFSEMFILKLFLVEKSYFYMLLYV